MSEPTTSDFSTLAQVSESVAQRTRALVAQPVAAHPQTLTNLTRCLTHASLLLEHPERAPEPVPSGNISTLIGALAARALQAIKPERNEPAANSGPKAPSTGHTLALRGIGPLLPAADLIGFLCGHKKTGVLEIDTARGRFHLELARGSIVHAECDPIPEGQRLGDHLVAQQALGREALESARQSTPRGRLGRMLLDSGLVTREQLLAALQAQVHQIFHHLFSAEVRQFAFWDGEPIHAEAEMKLDSMAVLLECARVADESQWIAQSE